MCSRYCLTTPSAEVHGHFKYVSGHDFPPRYNIAPTQPVAIVRLDANRERELALVRWGLIPGWVKKPDEFMTLLNARAETILEKPSFKAAIRHRRCIFPASGFYEWAGPARHKQAYLIARPDHGVLAFAGLWENWLGADGSEIETGAIVTVAANATIASIHDRMPAILPPDAWDEWLDPRLATHTAAAALLKPADESWLTLTAIGAKVGNSRFDDSTVQEPVTKTLL